MLEWARIFYLTWARSYRKWRTSDCFKWLRIFTFSWTSLFHAKSSELRSSVVSSFVIAYCVVLRRDSSPVFYEHDHWSAHGYVEMRRILRRIIRSYLLKKIVHFSFIIFQSNLGEWWTNVPTKIVPLLNMWTSRVSSHRSWIFIPLAVKSSCGYDLTGEACLDSSRVNRI